MEEPAAGAAVGLGHLDAHDAEIEQLVDQRARNLRLLVHFADQRPDLGLGELAHAVAENPLVFGEHGQRRGGVGGLLRHGAPPDVVRAKTANVIIGLLEAVRLRTVDAALAGDVRTICAHTPGPSSLVLALVAADRRPAARAASLQRPATRAPQPPASPAAGHSRPPARQPERAQQPPIRTGINFVRVDVIVTDSKGEPVLDLKPEEFTVTEDGKPQKIEQFTRRQDRRGRADRRRARPPRSAAPSTRSARPRAPTSGCSCCCSTTTTCGAATTWRCASRSIDFIQNQLDPADMVAIMYPLTPVADIRFSRDRNALIGAIERFEGRKFNYQPRNAFEEQYAYYPAQTVERIRNQVTMGALKAAAVRLGGLREGRKSIIFVSEGLHHDAAAAAERSDRGDARRRQSRLAPADRRRRRPTDMAAAARRLHELRPI